tara:strand:- start:1683 stop:2417 length:735 start_codon:yes stop_codon:yes gene_type:complete
MLKKKNILITGVGKGIGYELVKQCLNNGSYVYGLTRSKSDLKKFKNLKNCKIYIGDVINKNLINRILSQSIKDKRLISGFVNNAGIRQRKEFNNISKIDLLNVLNTNFVSVFVNMQLFSKYLIKKKISGSIVNIGSIVGKNGFSELSGYASSKTALSGLNKSFAVEMAKHNIRSNIISPGFIETSYAKNFKKNTKLYNWTISRIPQKRWGQASEVCNLICFLLSEKSSYITGSEYNIDGGWLAN